MKIALVAEHAMTSVLQMLLGGIKRKRYLMLHIPMNVIIVEYVGWNVNLMR